MSRQPARFHYTWHGGFKLPPTAHLLVTTGLWLSAFYAALWRTTWNGTRSGPIVDRTALLIVAHPSLPANSIQGYWP